MPDNEYAYIKKLSQEELRGEIQNLQRQIDHSDRIDSRDRDRMSALKREWWEREQRKRRKP